MYEEIDSATILATAVFVNYNITATYSRLDYKDIHRSLKATQAEGYIHQIDACFEDWTLKKFFSLGLFPNIYRLTGTSDLTKYILLLNLFLIFIRMGTLSPFFRTFLHLGFLLPIAEVWGSLVAYLKVFKSRNC